MEIRTIIFDLGNVVLTNDWHYTCPEREKEFSDYFGIGKGDMERGWEAAWPDYKTGKVTEDGFWDRFLRAAGARNPDTGKAKEVYRKHQKEIERMPDLLRRLKRRYGIAALTNIGKEWLEYKVSRFQLDEIFDVIISSGHSGVAKPDVEIYEIALKELDVSPYECVFVDNQESCLVPARELGMTAILFKNQSLLERELRELGIEF